MPNEFSMRFSTELVQGVVEQIREEFKEHDRMFTDRASEMGLEMVRLAIELEVARRTKLPHLIAESETKLRAHAQRQSERQQAELQRHVMESELEEMLKEDGWWGQALTSFGRQMSEIQSGVATEDSSPPSS